MINFYTWIFILLANSVVAQDIFGTQQILIDDLLSVQNVAHGDVTGNGYQDLIAAGPFESRVVLFENGPNGFETTTVLEDGENPRAVLAIDIDGDKDMDVVFSNNNNQDLEYIINNGDGTFSSPTTIASLIIGIFDLKAVDLDGDDDDDILLASSGVQPRWFENVNGTFFTEHIINGPAGRSLEVGDLDNDDDTDIVSSASGSTTCIWYENDGTGNFAAPQTIRGVGLATSSVFVSDVNGDNLKDVMVSINSEDTVSWFENLGSGTFGPELIISSNLEFARRVITADLDNDGDQDIITGSDGDLNTLVWFENTDGNGTFGDQIIITEEVDALFSIVAIDLDNDGDLDLASASRNDSKVAWYENTTILGIDGLKVVAFTVTPNPSSDFFIINATQAGVASYTMYDLQGKKITTYPANTHTIDARTLSAGVYILALQSKRGDVLYHKIVRK